MQQLLLAEEGLGIRCTYYLLPTTDLLGGTRW